MVFMYITTDTGADRDMGIYGSQATGNKETEDGTGEEADGAGISTKIYHGM